MFKAVLTFCCLHFWATYSFSTASPLDCVTESSLYDVFKCVKQYIIARGQILNLARFQQLYPEESVVEDWRAVIRAMLDTGNCPLMLPASIDEQMTCVVWQNKFAILLEKKLSNCRAVSGSGQCTSTSSKSYFEKGWGFFAVPLPGQDTLNVHFSSPHPLYDIDSGLQATGVFENVTGQSLMVSGARRDAYKTKSAGTCQTKYYPADGAHNINTMFHQTLLITREWQLERPWSCPHESCVFLQLHGKSASTCSSELVFMTPGFGGPSSADFINRNPDLPVRRLQSALRKISPSWNVTTPAESSCYMTGGSNVFGRVLNGVSQQHACTVPATGRTATGLFIHAEQMISSRRSLNTWTDAVKLAFKT